VTRREGTRAPHTLSLVEERGYAQEVWVVEIDLVEDWLLSVDEEILDLIAAALAILKEQGPGLGRPLVDTVVGSRHNNMKDLRPGSSGRSEVRILFAFDPKRRAILLVAGDKQGAWSRWYKTNITVADDRYDMHLEALKEQQEQEAKKKPLARKARRKKGGN
jgi:Uncharacterized protein conserved in bacteria